MKALLALIMVCVPVSAQVPPKAVQYRSTLVREAQAIYGLSAPVPMFAGQIHQESAWRADVTAWDNGRGLAQFMDGTATQVSKAYPELGLPDPYNPRWAIRAMIRLDEFNFKRVRGENECEKWGGALKSYNAGLGYVLQAQKISPNPDKWFGYTEYIPTKQSAQNFEYSRTYPRKILFKHQPIYSMWGKTICIER